MYILNLSVHVLVYLQIINCEYSLEPCQRGVWIVYPSSNDSFQFFKVTAVFFRNNVQLAFEKTCYCLRKHEQTVIRMLQTRPNKRNAYKSEIIH